MGSVLRRTSETKMREKMSQYKVQYTIKGGGVMREEVLTARSDYEARQTLESRYPKGAVYIVTVTKIS